MIALLNPPGTYTTMLFEISRTSSRCDYTEQPCEGAVLSQRPRVDRRTVDDPKKLRFGSDTWYQHGTNHRVEDGHIVRDMEMVSIWVIDIQSLDALMTFIRECGDAIVLSETSIEIYDDRRED